MKKLKIIQTPVRFYPAVGGVEKYSLDLSRELVKRGHSVKVICANEPNSKAKEVDGIKVERLPYCGKVSNTNISLGLLFNLLKENFDVIHTHMPTPWSADFSMIASIIKRKPLVLTYHNDVLKEGVFSYLIEVYNNTLLKLILKRAKRILITQPDYVNTSRYLKKYKDKTEIIPNGIDLSKFKDKDIRRHNCQLFFLSVLDKHHRYKGLGCLLKAISIVKEKIPQIKLIVGGKGELIEEYERLSTKLRINNNVKFIGFVPDNELLDLYSQSRIFILPSITHEEGFGIVLLEAMACKTPVIATDIVGVAKEVRQNNCGIIVKPRNSQALAEAIIKILKNPKLAKKMGENGRKLVEEKYNWKEISKKVEKIYQQVII